MGSKPFSERRGSESAFPRLLLGAGLALLLQGAAVAQPNATGGLGAENSSNAMAAAIFGDHILLRPGQTILVRLGDRYGRITPRFVAEGEAAQEGGPDPNQVRFTFMPEGGPPVLRVENHAEARLSFKSTYRDGVGNQTTPESCPAFRGVTDMDVPPRAVRVEIQDFRWGGHERYGQECGPH